MSALSLTSLTEYESYSLPDVLPSALMSYQLLKGIPLLILTGRSGACNNLIRAPLYTGDLGCIKYS
jgi:hypothetical protein